MLAQTDDLTDLEKRWFDGIPCEGPTHANGDWGHVPIQDATWRIVAPCGVVRLLCDGYTQFMIHEKVKQYVCSGPGGCMRTHPRESFKITKL